MRQSVIVWRTAKLLNQHCVIIIGFLVQVIKDSLSLFFQQRESFYLANFMSPPVNFYSLFIFLHIVTFHCQSLVGNTAATAASREYDTLIICFHLTAHSAPHPYNWYLPRHHAVPCPVRTAQDKCSSRTVQILNCKTNPGGGAFF